MSTTTLPPALEPAERARLAARYFHPIAELSDAELQVARLRLGLLRQLAGVLEALDAIDDSGAPAREVSCWALEDVFDDWHAQRVRREPVDRTGTPWREAV